ncbi:MAG: hypothetical protein GY778_27320 [bacterium]|nr:hypothetical protein [bacterium]
MRHSLERRMPAWLALACAGLALAGPTPAEQVRPGKLLIYYAFPSMINGAATVDDAATEFGQYEVAVVGDGLQDGPGDPDPHPDHANTVAIMAHAATADTMFFGYIDLGVTTNNHSLMEIQRRVDAWQGMGIEGIFLDDFGYDFDVTRVRQNAAVDYIHAAGLPVCANAWQPDDAFGDQVHPKNPSGVPTSLGADDFYLSESYQVREGVIVEEATWQNKANPLRVYQGELGFEILSITTVDASGAYDESKFFYAWHSAAMYGHFATGWGESGYSAQTALAPFRTRPTESLGTLFKTGIAKNGSLYTRHTERGTLFVNAAAPSAGFTPAPDGDGDGVADTYDVCAGTPVGSQVKPNGSPLGDTDCDCDVDLKDMAILQVNFAH